MRLLKNTVFQCLLLLCLIPALWAGTFGKVIPIGGHASDIALDERRGVVYVANFGANRVEVLSMADETLGTPIQVAPEPGTLSVSPDGRYLVVGHYEGSLTILDLDAKTRQILPVDSKVLSVAFGGGPLALVVTEAGFKTLEPATATLTDLAPQPLTSKGVPVPFATFPPEIVEASASPSRDGRYVVGLAEGSGAAITFRYDLAANSLVIISIEAVPPLGPRVVSVNGDGSRFVVGWALMDTNAVLWAEFPAPDGALNIGSHAWDTYRNVIYAQLPEPGSKSSGTGGLGQPVLHILDSDNLTVRERLRLAENLAGKSLIRGDSHVMYAVSDSGVMILPIGSLYAVRRVTSLQEDVLFRGTYCNVGVASQEIDITDPSGGATDFSLSSDNPAVTVSPASGTTPARVKVSVDMKQFQDKKGTSTSHITINSVAGANLPMPVRVLVNTREPEQRGSIYNVPGRLVDILADPVRNRFYIIRQDKNQVQVYDGTGFNLITVMRTGNTPTQMTMTRDFRYLIVGNNDSQIANVFDLDSLQPTQPIIFPFGHYPRSIAVSNVGMFGAVRGVSTIEGCDNAGPNTIDRIDFATRTATAACTLGIYNNSTSENTVLTASPSGSMIFGAMPDGTVLLYDASADTFVASRNDFSSLAGAYAAVSDQMFVADNNVLNWSLVPVGALSSATGLSSGFAYVDGYGLRTTSPSISSPGVIQWVDLVKMEDFHQTKMIESPLLATSPVPPPVGQIGQVILPFSRTLAPLANRNSFVSLSTSGFTVLPWNFDAALAKPNLNRVTNLADGSTAVAPGGLISVFGSNLSGSTVSNSQLPVPTELGESCLSINGVLAPLFLASPGQINAQLPFEVSGNATATLRTPGGTSNNFSFPVLASAPAVFRTGTAGPQTGFPTIYRALNNELVTLANPIHPEDIILIYATGLGATSPAVSTGYPAPSDPLAEALIAPQITLGGVTLGIQYAGLVPGQVGVYQINAFVPLTVPRGMQVPLTITQGGEQVSFNVRVVD